MTKPPRLQCGAMTASGHPCRLAPIRWGTRCKYHGGASPFAKQAALERMLAARDFAAKALYDVLTTRPPCEHCGRRDDAGVVVRAAQVVLDRTGFGPHASLQIEQRPAPTPWAAYLTNEQLEQVSVWIAEAKRRHAEATGVTDDAPESHEPLALPAAQEGEVVDETTDTGEL